MKTKLHPGVLVKACLYSCVITRCLNVYHTMEANGLPWQTDAKVAAENASLRSLPAYLRPREGSRRMNLRAVQE